MMEVEQILEKIPGTKQLLSLGIGILTVAGLLVKIGD
jgi:hypothetical protein